MPAALDPHEPLKIAGCTVAEALRFGTARLQMRDDLRENAARDAQQILEIATGLTRVQMLAQPDRPLREEEAGSFQGMICAAPRRRSGAAYARLAGVLWARLCRVARCTDSSA